MKINWLSVLRGIGTGVSVLILVCMVLFLAGCATFCCERQCQIDCGDLTAAECATLKEDCIKGMCAPIQAPPRAEYERKQSWMWDGIEVGTYVDSNGYIHAELQAIV